MNEFDAAEVNERLGELLPSQYEFVFSPARFSMISGGFASGKSRAGVTKGLLLSAKYPGNVGMIARFHGTDLEDSTIPVFFEVCPPSWIKRYNKNNRTVILRNGSVIMFRHIHDASATKKDSASAMGPKTRRLGANLGWFFIDQAEELSIEHWLAMISRLRLPRAPLKYGFGAMNPNGHDWLWKAFFNSMVPWVRDDMGRVTQFYQHLHPAPNISGIVVNSEENRESNGGFVEDAYFDSLLTNYPPEWIERYIYSSFDDFSGKIYKEYRAGLIQVGASTKYEEDEVLSSVHNVIPFAIPKHWELIVGIDVGGAGKWAITPTYVDDRGNLIVTQGYHRKAGNIAEIATWIKGHLPWNENRTRYVIDWENRVAMIELAEHGIHSTPAKKHVIPNILRIGGYIHVQKGRALPDWYVETQPEMRVKRFTGASPRIFFFKSDHVVRAEHDSYVWHPTKPNEPFKTNERRWDSCDAVAYVGAARPEPSVLGDDGGRFDMLAKTDPLSYREWVKFDQRIQARQDKMGGKGSLREADLDEIPEGLSVNELGARAEYSGEGEF
jgi:hypothetical protein